MTFKPASQVSFGVEIECNIPNEHRALFPVGSYHHGTQIPGLSQGWNGQSDGSVNATYGTFPVEIVSPKLTGEAGLVDLMQAIDYLDQHGARTNDTCGLHVHISCEGLSQSEITRVVKLFKAFEKAFFALNGEKYSSRYNSHYCAPSPRWNDTRYQSLNLKHVFDGHLEIRVWAGSMKPETILAAVYMATALISRATDPRPVKTSHLTNNKKVVMASYIQQFVKGESMVIPDLDPADVFSVMMAEAIRAHVSTQY
jgi:hypothetical protein